MFNISKAIKLLIIVLSLVILGEFAFLYYKISQNPHERTRASEETLVSPEMQICVPVKNDTLLNAAILEQLKTVPDVAFSSSEVINTFRGQIVAFNTDGGSRLVDKSKYKNSPVDSIEYQVELRIKDHIKPDTVDFYWPANVLSKLNVYYNNSGEIISMNFNDLKVGDLITIEEKINLTNKNCVSFDCITHYKIIRE